MTYFIDVLFSNKKKCTFYLSNYVMETSTRAICVCICGDVACIISLMLILTCVFVSWWWRLFLYTTFSDVEYSQKPSTMPNVDSVRVCYIATSRRDEAEVRVYSDRADGIDADGKRIACPLSATVDNCTTAFRAV